MWGLVPLLSMAGIAKRDELTEIKFCTGSDNLGFQRCLSFRQIQTRKAEKARKHGTFGTT